MQLLKFILVLSVFICSTMQGQLKYSEIISLGEIAEAYEIKGSTIVQNIGTTKLYLLRADADYGIKIQTSKKTLQAGDTALLSIWFSPDKAGKFSKTISLVHSQSAEPAKIKLSGSLVHYKADDKTACFYFGEKHNQSVATLTALPLPSSATVQTSSSTVSPLITAPTVSGTASTTITPKTEPKATEQPISIYKGNLPEAEYKPNNLIFLVDVSSSMRDSLKLPLMKLALYELVNEMREVDRVTFITYADTVKILAQGVSSVNKDLLIKQVSALKAKGMTKGRKAILFSQQVAQQHFIEGGNNQIIIASDGQFKFEKEDQKLWKERQGHQAIVISTIAFGSDKNAIRTLKSIARVGKGSFIQIQTKEESRQKLLEEIKRRSKKDNR